MSSTVASSQITTGGSPRPSGAPGDGHDGVLVIERPAPNMIKVVDLASARELSFHFSLADVKVAVLDVDVVLIFPDGAKIILPGFAFAVVALEAPAIVALDGPVDGQTFLSLVGDTKLADQLPTLRLTDLDPAAPKAEGQNQSGADQGPGESDPAPPPTPPRVDQSAADPDVNHGRYADEVPVEDRRIESENYTSYSTASFNATSSHNKTDDPVPPAPPIVEQDSNLAVKLFAHVEQTIDMLEHERELQQIDSRISDLTSNIPQTESAIVEIGRRRIEAGLHYRTDAEKERADTELQLAKLVETVAAMSDRATRTEVSAPISGTVNKLFASTVGGTVKSGEPLAQIVPADASIEVEARLSPADRAEVWPGLPAVVKISAYDYSVYGGLKGTVTDISSDALQDERGEAYFRIRLKAQASDFGPDRPVVPGMVADVDILSGRQSIMEALLRPARILRDNALRL